MKMSSRHCIPRHYDGIMSVRTCEWYKTPSPSHTIFAPLSSINLMIIHSDLSLQVCEEESTAATLTGVQLFMHFSPMLAKGFPNAVQGQVAAVEQVEDL